ncbi:MAG: ECF transporter S component [Erysipelotrichaceae bacterium]|nr:ECF transporter S component [Erysipelotrichaceae bacterium]
MEIQTQKTSTKSNLTTRKITMIATFTAISFVLAFIELPVPFSPSFAKFDLSDLPALIIAFAYGPMEALMIEFIKNLLQLTTSSTGGIGEFANFVMGESFVFVAGTIYKYKKTKTTAWISIVVGSIVMSIMAAIMNYFVLLPLFETFMPLDQLIQSFSAFIPFINSKLDIVLYNAIPFNLVKGLMIGIVTMLVYKRLSSILKGKL